MRRTPLVTGRIYHIFNRGVNKQDIFLEKLNYSRFLKAAIHYKYKNSKFSYERGFNTTNNETGSLNAKVEVLAYCLMSNHFHFLVKQLEDNGVTNYFQRLLNSYAHYVNVKNGRIGPLFAGRYKNVLIENDEQFIHVSRYIHLNPFVARLVSDLKNYPWSSYRSYVSGEEDELSSPEEVLKMFNSRGDYENFVINQADYGVELEKIKHLTFDDNP